MGCCWYLVVLYFFQLSSRCNQTLPRKYQVCANPAVGVSSQKFRYDLLKQELMKSGCIRLSRSIHDWEGLESVPLLTLLAVGSFSFVAGGIV